ncbi:hypothetical protein [Mammaliicoccus vitulinus]|uniref:hypothetical protein n=1 Tax=Mammaliicoccus vitulinus TaxID=71237 RepID=UPI0018668854|nr:hypothetical protein [Mammaliicoccus vitulinus]
MAETKRNMFNKVSGVKEETVNTDEKDTNITDNTNEVDDNTDKQIEELKAKVTELEKQLADKDEKLNSDKNNVKERLVSFVKTRPDGKISDLTTRTTFIIENRVLERLDNYFNYMEASNASNSNYNPHNKNETELIADRGLSKGILSKLMSFSLNETLDEWNSVDPIPNTEKARYPVQVRKERGTGYKKEYHRAYMFELKGVTYGISIDERSNQNEYYTTAEPPKENESNDESVHFNVDKKVIEEWFKKKQELEKTDKEKKQKKK